MIQSRYYEKWCVWLRIILKKHFKGEKLMKKTSIKKLLSIAISLMLLVSAVSSLALTAGALPETGVQDLGDSFIAALTLRYQNVVLNNNGDNTVSAVKYDGVENEEPAKDVFADAQLWKFEKQENGSYKITSKLDGKCLEVVSMATDNVSTVGVWEDNGAECQRFFPYTIYGKYVFIPAHAADKAIEVNQANFSVHIYDYADDKVNEQFHVEVVEVLEDTTSEDATSEEATDATSEEATDATSEEATDATSEEATDTTSEEAVSAEESSEAAASKEEASEEEKSSAAEKSSEAEKSQANSSAANADKDGGSPVVIVIVCVAVVAVIAVVVIVIKKKK